MAARLNGPLVLVYVVVQWEMASEAVVAVWPSAMLYTQLPLSRRFL